MEEMKGNFRRKSLEQKQELENLELTNDFLMSECKDNHEAEKTKMNRAFEAGRIRAVREGVSTDSLKFHAGPPCPTLICPAGGPPPQMALWPFGGWPAHRAGSLWPSYSPLDTPSRTGVGRIIVSYSVISGEFHDQGDYAKR
jgi:hypothetical protein